MRITKLRTWLVEGIKYNWTLVKLETEDGLTGIGEATNWPGSTMVEAACQAVGNHILGEDSQRIDFLWSKCYRDMNWLGQAGPLLSAISAVDIALWDIAGKRAGMPVYHCSVVLTGNAFNCTRITGLSTAMDRRAGIAQRRRQWRERASRLVNSIRSRNVLLVRKRSER